MTTKHPRKTSLGKLAAGALVAAGLVMVAGSTAMADSWKHGNGHGAGRWSRRGGHGHTSSNEEARGVASMAAAGYRTLSGRLPLADSTLAAHVEPIIR